MKSFSITLFYLIIATTELFGQSLGNGNAGFSDQQPVKLDKPIRFSNYKDGAFPSTCTNCGIYDNRPNIKLLSKT